LGAFWLHWNAELSLLYQSKNKKAAQNLAHIEVIRLLFEMKIRVLK